MKLSASQFALFDAALKDYVAHVEKLRRLAVIQVRDDCPLEDNSVRLIRAALVRHSDLNASDQAESEQILKRLGIEL